MGRLVLALWLCALGAVVLYVFFAGLGGVSPWEVGGVTAVLAALALMFTLRTARLARDLRDRAGDPQLHAEYNRARERRGF